MTLSDADLSFMRESIEELLPDTCDILSLSKTPDGSGGVTESLGTAYASVSCRLDTINGNFRDYDGVVKTYEKLVFSFPQDTIITVDNRVQYGSNTYEITAVNDGSWLGVKRAEVTKI